MTIAPRMAFQRRSGCSPWSIRSAGRRRRAAVRQVAAWLRRPIDWPDGVSCDGLEGRPPRGRRFDLMIRVHRRGNKHSVVHHRGAAAPSPNDRRRLDAIGRVARAARRLGISSAGGDVKCASGEEPPSITHGDSGTGPVTMARSGSRTRVGVKKLTNPGTVGATHSGQRGVEIGRASWIVHAARGAPASGPTRGDYT